MGTGNKTELVTFEREARTPDGMGGFTNAWTSIGQAWAEVKWKSGGESQRQGAVRAVNKYSFTIYAAASDEMAITTKDRIVWDNEVLNIRESPRASKNTTDVDIIAESGVTQ